VQQHLVSPDDFINNHPEWAAFIGHNKVQTLLQTPCDFYQNEISNKTVFPPPEFVFKAFDLLPHKVTCCLIGQDPYHTKGMATGLAFSVPDNIKRPPSLKNMAKEAVKANPQSSMQSHGDLNYLAEQGVFLINTALSVNEGDADSHKKAKWALFTHEVIRLLGNRDKPLVFLAWGTKAHKLVEGVPSQHTVIKTSHPSPLGATKNGKDFTSFLGSNCFDRVNSSLVQMQQPSIRW